MTPADRAGTFRLRAGRIVLFEIITTLDLERDTPAYAKLAAALSSPSAPCELRATLTAERQAPVDKFGKRRNLGSDARFTIGEASVDLRVLLAGGSDLLCGFPPRQLAPMASTPLKDADVHGQAVQMKLTS